ncbi:hypothetical protein O181_010990 [Austropuccinia psidii MF-1]|uniref:Uncharacterized protein n=1 Tax=Austropuccinia psidii MF-1 TaxID=1389203 RepID=A0A9Q3BUA3_9BASI|nr:hypothetical protein [Austropuccinia psidii MF-1]
MKIRNSPVDKEAVSFADWKIVSTDGKASPKELVEEFPKAQELTKKRKENEVKESLPKQKKIKLIQLKKDDISFAIEKIEDWGSWKPQTISSANDSFHDNYGLRNTKQRSSIHDN